LNKINTSNWQIDHYLHKKYDSTSYREETVNCIFEDSRGILWIGGNNGLNRYMPGLNSFEHYTTANGLPSNVIMGILEDGKGYLWVSSNKGLFRFHPDKESVKLFEVPDGLQSEEYNKACCKLEDGRMIFGGVNGFNLFHPGQLAYNDVAPGPQVTSFQVFDKLVSTDFTNKDTIRLSYKQNFFSIHFSALDYTAPGKNLYAYQLKGIDKNWRYTRDHSTNYTNIDPGKYIFQVKASNNDGVWSEKPESLMLIVKPPFWKTTWFLLLSIFTVTGILLLLLADHIRKIKVRNRAILLEQQLLRSQMNPHFIFNSLTAIQGFFYSKDPSGAARYLSKFSRLMRLILENSRVEYAAMDKEIKTIENYLELQKLRFDEKFDYRVVVDDAIDAEMIAIPPMLAQPFVENAIEHGILAKQEKGFIEVRYLLQEESVLIEVEDDGVGIEYSLENKLEDQKKHQSLATKISRERLQNLYRYKKKNIQFRVLDKKKLGKKSGTLVSFMVPYRIVQ
jgi:hypothetical protein